VMSPGCGSHSEAGVNGGVYSFLRPVYRATSARVCIINDDDDDDTRIARINMQHLREKIQFPCFQFRKVVQKH